MRYVWRCGEDGCLGAEVQDALNRVRPVALTTILTTLDRLRDKGILAREREGKPYRYRAVLTEVELQQRIVGGVLDGLIAQFPKAVATYFAQQARSPESDEAAALKELAQRLEAMGGESDDGT